MRKIWPFLFFLCFLNLSHAQDIPEPTGWVNDFAGVINPEYKDKLTALIEEVEQKTTSEIAVVTIESISPYDEKEYARLLFDNWRPGKKGKDNGVLVLVAIKERRWRIETGYGTEGILPDGLCGEIGREFMVAYFKEGRYAEGIYQGVLKISQVIAKDANVSLAGLEGIKEPLPQGADPSDSFIPLFFLITIGFIIFLNYLSYKHRRWYGYYGGSGTRPWGDVDSGGFGGGFGGFGGGGGGGGGAGGGF